MFVAKPILFDYNTTIDSIREFLNAYPLAGGLKYAMIMDNAPWHQKAIRLIEDESMSEYEDIRRKVEFIKLPPYSPDLNPIEQVWRITRREHTHNRYFSSKTALTEVIDNAFAKWRLPNEKLRTLCTFKRKY